MIVVTGAAGFISSCLVAGLNSAGRSDLILVDDFDRPMKEANWKDKSFLKTINRVDYFSWADDNASEIEFIFHLGARTDTTEFDVSIFDELNIGYSQKMWEFAAKNNIPLVYASSAATYGLGELGYKDEHDIVSSLKPLNPYGESKNNFDAWALQQTEAPPFWAGLKFFNVYGPNEFHKGRMASVIFHAFHQITKTGAMKLFASHNPDFEDGEQLRDFIYVKDVVKVCEFMMNAGVESGLYNLGTGKARSFNDLTKATFAAMGVEENISFIPTPEDIRDKYQYYTQADMNKLIGQGYDLPFVSLEEGVADYVKHYLTETNYL